MGPIEREGRALTEEQFVYAKRTRSVYRSTSTVFQRQLYFNLNCTSWTVAAAKAQEIAGALKLDEVRENAIMKQS